MRGQSSVFSEIAPVLSPWPLFLSQPVGPPPSLSSALPPSHLPGPTQALHPACIFPGLISFFPLSRLLPAASANFPQLQPLPHDHRLGTAWVGEDPPPFPSPGWSWDGEISAIGAWLARWSGVGVNVTAGGYGLPAPALLFLGTLFLVARTGPTWGGGGAEASGRAAVWGQWCRESGTRGPNCLYLVLFSN